MYLLWCLYTLYLPACQVTGDVPLVEFMYLVFTRMPGNRRCTSGDVYVPCIYPHAMLQAMYLWWGLCTLYLLACQVTDAVPLVGFMYLLFTRMLGEIPVGDSGLYCCVRVTS